MAGEYLSLALMIHAGFGSILWALWSLTAPEGLLVVLAGLWTIGRAAGLFAQRVFTPLVTAGLLVMMFTLWQRGSVPAAYLRVFSPLVFLVMLSTVFLFDVAERLTSTSTNAVVYRISKWNWYRIAVRSFGLAFLLYVVVIPVASSVFEAMGPEDPAPPLDDELTLGSKIGLRTMEGMTASVFFALGATIGSFLNVVVFRMPRGESVVSRPSRCPKCEIQINGRDNVPILGWLLLEGRCRACKIPISARYPIVESICAAMFFLLFFVELISGGANIPVRRPNFYHGVVWIIFYTKWDLIALYLFHCFSLCTLLTWALVDVDRQRIPIWARSVAVGILLAIPMLRTDLFPVPWMHESEYGLDLAKWQGAVLTGVIGGLTGAVLGWLVAIAIRKPVEPSETEPAGETFHWSSGHIVSASLIVGMSVGWQATVGVWLVTLVAMAVVSRVAAAKNVSHMPVTGILFAGHLTHLLAWRLLNRTWWPSLEATPVFWAVSSGVFVTLCLAIRTTQTIEKSSVEASSVGPS